jgi:hypothetical protein
MIALLLFVAGCGGANNTPTPVPPTPTAPTTPAPAMSAPTLEPGWTRYEKAEEGFSIALPPRWEQIDMDPQTLEASLDAVSEQNPELATVLEGQARNLVVSGIKFFGFDMTPSALATGYATNVNVLVQALGLEMSVDVFAQVSVAQLKNMDMVEGEVSQRRVNLAGGEGVELKYRWKLTTPIGEAITVAVTQYAVIRGEDAYVISFGTTADQAERYGGLFWGIAQSFLVLE